MSGIKVRAIPHFGLAVSDLERSLEFYHNALGLELVSKREVSGDHISAGVQVPDAQIKIALLEGGNAKLELLEYTNPIGQPFDRSNSDAGSAHVTFEVTDLQATYDRLQSLGVPCNAPPYPSSFPKGTGWFYARDPDGITVEFNGPLNTE